MRFSDFGLISFTQGLCLTHNSNISLLAKAITATPPYSYITDVRILICVESLSGDVGSVFLIGYVDI